MTDSEDDIIASARERIGKVLREKWRLEGLLGIGGMAAVYAAAHVNNGKRVAIKLLHPEVLSNAEARSRFLREGYVANKVGHPGTVQVLDDDVAEDGSVFLVMELLEGESFEARRVRSANLLPAIEVLKVADRVLDVLAMAHEKGIVHRDIKPDNIFLTSDGGVKLLDFGIARLRDSMRRATMTSGGAIGTPAFMPPEQARGRWDDVGPRTDIWALGATMYTALTGRLVHEADTVNELLLAAMTKPARPLASVLPGVPAPVSAIVDRALAYEMSGRWTEARAMQTAVRMAFQALGDPGGTAKGRWGGTMRMPTGSSATSDLAPPSVAPRGAVPAMGGMMAAPLVAPLPPRAPLPSVPGAPFPMADPITGRVSGMSGEPSTRPSRPSGLLVEPNVNTALGDQLFGSGQQTSVYVDPRGTGQHAAVYDPRGTGQHAAVQDPRGAGQQAPVYDARGTGQHAALRLDPGPLPLSPQFASGGFSSAPTSPLPAQSMSTGQPVMLGEGAAPKPARSVAALVVAALGLLVLVAGVVLFVVLRGSSGKDVNHAGPTPTFEPSATAKAASPSLEPTALPPPSAVESAAPPPAASEAPPEPSASARSTKPVHKPPVLRKH